MKIVLTEQAQNDQDDIYDYIRERSARGAFKVVTAVERTFRLISEHPEIGEATDREGIRAIAVPRFPYWVFYRIGVDSVEVVHIRHAARQPWASS